MSKDSHTGKRRERNRTQQRKPEIGYFLIVTDTKETERNYFAGLKKSLMTSLPCSEEELNSKIQIVVKKTETKNLVDVCRRERNIRPQYCDAWIVFDRDDVQDFDNIISSAVRSDIKVAWSNPCIETWFFGYFGSIPATGTSVICCKKFGEKFKEKNGHSYEKNDPNIYAKLRKFSTDSEAIDIAKARHMQFLCDGCQKASEMIPCTTMYKIVASILNL